MWELRIEPGEREADAEERSYVMGREHAERLRNAGKKPYIIPMGGASEVGSIGFISGFLELTEQLEAINVQADYLYHATGTGGTLAGLVAGRALLGSNMNIISVAVSAKDSSYEARTADLANRSLGIINPKGDVTVNADSIVVDRDHFAPGYEIPNEGGNNAIRRLARTEGILLDTVYSGKAFYGLLDNIEKGLVKPGSNVVFWHTGGATALFAEKAIIGDLAEK